LIENKNSMEEIPKIVRQRLQAVARPGEHPGANLLGAFVERSLGTREQDQVLQHLSECISCREIVSLAANQPGIADAASVVRASPSWLSWPALRWGAALACVVVVGAAVTLRQRQESKPFAERAETVASLPVANSGVEKKVASLQVPKSEAKIASGAELAASGRKTITPKQADGNHAASNTEPVEMTEARTASPLVDVVPGRAKNALAESQSSATEATGGPLAMKKGMMGPATGEAFVPENLVPRWTLSADGTLQRSLDSGSSWQTIQVASQKAIFRALSANGFDIWVGGAAGALYHSSDAGQQWTQVRPVVNGEALADDIIGVEFRDALHGKLTSAKEETWVTADAGQTWQKQ
jgi:photosynthesis system II assembly factor YCF48-like protein